VTHTVTRTDRLRNSGSGSAMIRTTTTCCKKVVTTR
jgi:hypothetical protein